jgi:hypothetical protein
LELQCQVQTAMIDKEFCEQYVTLIDRPATTKIEKDMIKIVEYHDGVYHIDAFTINEVKSLDKGSVISKIYSFILENQDLWVYKKDDSV